MPSVPIYLSGVHSNKVRNFLNYFNGMAGILRLDLDRRVASGLRFDVQTHDCPLDAVQWAADQVAMTWTTKPPTMPAAVACFELRGTCDSAGTLRALAHVFHDEGKWSAHFDFTLGG